MNSLESFLSGAVAMQYFVASLFFLKYKQKIGDNFFGYFAAAFGLLGIERIVAFILGNISEIRPTIYLIRLFAFTLIIFAVLIKNRSIESPKQNNLDKSQ